MNDGEQKRCLNDTDDEVRDRAVMYIALLEGDQSVEVTSHEDSLYCVLCIWSDRGCEI